MSDTIDTAAAGGTTGSKGALVGVAAALVGLAATMVPAAGFSVADDIPVETMVEKLGEASASLMIGGGLQAITAMALVVYGAFLRQSLQAREAPGALTPTVAWGGVLLTAALSAMAAAHTQLAGAMETTIDPAILLTLHTLEENLFAGAWCSLALAAGAVAVAGLARGAVQRWLGGVSAFIAVLLLIAQLVVPWAAWFPALVWVAVSTFALRTRATMTR